MADTLVTVPDTSENEFSEEQIYRMILLEIWEKTEGLGILWNELATGMYEAEFSLQNNVLYTIRIGRSGQVYVLDVHKNKSLWFTRHSGIDPNVERLYLEISAHVHRFIPEVPDWARCHPPVYYLEVMRGGVVVGDVRQSRFYDEDMQGGVIIASASDWKYDFPCRCKSTDVCILMDTTGSMGGAIAKMVLYFTEIRKAFDSPDCRWAVCDYRDFEDGYSNGYVVRQTFTNDYDDVADALDLLEAGGGGDGEEQNYAALKGVADHWESDLGGHTDININRCVIWCGDFPGWNDGAKGFAYPRFDEVVDAFINNRIKLMALNVYGPNDGIDDGAPRDGMPQQATRLTEEIGGRVLHWMATAELEDVLEDVCDFLIEVGGEFNYGMHYHEEMHNGVVVQGTATNIRIRPVVETIGGTMLEGVATVTP